MKYCPKCNANIEGLTRHCDCCGAPIKVGQDFVIWHLYVTAAAGDLPQYVKKICNELNTVASAFNEVTPRLVFEIFCYPDDMIRSLKIKEGIRHSRTKKCVTVKLIVDYERYVGSERSEKELMIAEAIHKSILCVHHRTGETYAGLNELL